MRYRRLAEAARTWQACIASRWLQRQAQQGRAAGRSLLHQSLLHRTVPAVALLLQSSSWW